tara:strand:- start:1346 stop:1870 length:525 start_codon:yes stop_codon:yes gene_type:complete
MNKNKMNRSALLRDIKKKSGDFNHSFHIAALKNMIKNGIPIRNIISDTDNLISLKDALIYASGGTPRSITTFNIIGSLIGLSLTAIGLFNIGYFSSYLYLAPYVWGGIKIMSGMMGLVSLWIVSKAFQERSLSRPEMILKSVPSEDCASESNIAVLSPGKNEQCPVPACCNNNK